MNNRQKEAEKIRNSFRIKDVECIHNVLMPKGNQVVLINFDKNETVRASGLITKISEDRALPMGVVVGIGEEVSENVNIGDLVFYKCYEKTDIIFNEKLLVIINEGDIKLYINPKGDINSLTKTDEEYLKSVKWGKHQEKLKEQDRKTKVHKDKMRDIENMADMGINKML